MSNLSIKDRTLTPARVTKLAAGKEMEAIAAAQKNGADDVVFKIGEDHYLASGRGMALRGVKPSDAIKLDGKQGQVVMVDRQLNTFGEGMLAWPGLAVGGAGVAWGLVGFAQGLMTGATFAGLGLMLAGAAAVVGLAINLAPAAYGALRKVDL